MKAFDKRSMKLLREIRTIKSFSCSSPPVPTELAYIHRLPAELLQQVFLLIVNDIPGCPSIFSLEYNTISLNVSNPPLVFTRVCRLWRAVAYSTPEVWSRILVALPGKVKPWKPFLPYFLQCWLARSVRLPLTLWIVDDFQNRKCNWIEPVADSRLLDILLSESQRWETVSMSPVQGWNPDFNTPQLKALECNESNLRNIDAPKLSYLRVDGYFCLTVPNGQSTLTCRDLCHIRLRAASAPAICSTIASFAHLETIVVDKIIPFHFGDVPAPISNLVLESMTLPLPFYFLEDTRQEFIKIFTRLHLPMLRKLTLVGAPEKLQVDCLLAMLAVASFQVPVVEFRTGTAPLSTVHKNNITSLLSVVREVTYYG
ncbi:uncharacterized protein BJ212DRAFT_1476141 [Suillus subaureus]|uniref:F-box domain-containing protein n=1 Tax=Suillus subaureus TaxID=48587 RepID=A0A9P7ELT3_9AGAM|nr:uncharacterized protein BJ212DRAFT_1476141 [Suillus subaureus]KAG1824852.1 hypothetical protein BJ212DRAFT_1476141 [Suillus subaureus]